MKHITGFKKEIVLLSNLKSKQLRNMPLSALWYLQRTFDNEKLTKVNGQYVINTFMPPFPSLAFERLIKNSIDVFHHNVSPYSAYISLTNKCGFNCWHCSRVYRNGEEISVQRWIEIINELLEMGVCIIGFTGGEPLYRSDLEVILKSIDNRATSILFTTGEGLDNSRAKKLKEAGLCYIAISLDHYDAQEHNKLRGSERAFSVALDAIKTSIGNNFYTAVQLTARKEAADPDFLYKYLSFANKLGVQEIRVIEPMPTGKLITEGREVFFHEKERNTIKEFHKKVNKDAGMPKIAAFAFLEDAKLYGCGAGVQHIYIDAFGNLCPCDFTPLSFGNIRNESLKVVFTKLHQHFNTPRDKCFILENIDKLRPYFDKELPIGQEESGRICAECPKGNLPTYYKKLGWK